MALESSTLVPLRVVVPVEAPDRVLILPWGRVESTSGDFFVDQRAADEIVAAFLAGGLDLVIDYEHASIGPDFPQFRSPDGTAPAAGWIRAIEIEPGVGLFGRVDWTQRGADSVRSRQYRYMSPVIAMSKSDGRVVAIRSVALTNTPAIRGFPAIVNRAGTIDTVAHAGVDDALSRFRTARRRINVVNCIAGEYDRSNGLKGSSDRDQSIARTLKIRCPEMAPLTPDEQHQLARCRHFLPEPDPRAYSIDHIAMVRAVTQRTSAGSSGFQPREFEVRAGRAWDASLQLKLLFSRDEFALKVHSAAALHHVPHAAGGAIDRPSIIANALRVWNTSFLECSGDYVARNAVIDSFLVAAGQPVLDFADTMRLPP
ncbi:MAG: phage protease [Phycisphaerae bacterium]